MKYRVRVENLGDNDTQNTYSKERHYYMFN